MNESYIERVESFIQRFNDLDIVIDQNARNIPFSKYESGQPPQQKNLADVLALMIESYNEYKHTEFKEFSAKTLAGWIDKAIAFGVVKEGQGVTRGNVRKKNRNYKLHLTKYQREISN